MGNKTKTNQTNKTHPGVLRGISDAVKMIKFDCKFHGGGGNHKKTQTKSNLPKSLVVKILPTRQEEGGSKGEEQAYCLNSSAKICFS